MLKNKLSNEIDAQKKKPETPKSQIKMKEQINSPKSNLPITIQVEDIIHEDEAKEKQQDTLGTNISKHSEVS